MMWMHRSKDNVSQVPIAVVQQGQGLGMRTQNQGSGEILIPQTTQSHTPTSKKEETGHKKV